MKMWFLNHVEHCRSKLKWTPMCSPSFSKYELYVLDARIFLKCTLCGLLQNLLSIEFVHKPSFKAISYDARYTYVSHGPSANGSVSPHQRAGSITFQPVSIGEEGARHCAAVHQLSNPPARTNRPVLLCHCKWEKQLAMFIISALDWERIQFPLQSPTVCQHPKREPGARQHPKGLSVDHHDSHCALN